MLYYIVMKSCIYCYIVTLYYIVVLLYCVHNFLVGGLEHFLFFPIVGMMIQSDFHIFQRGRYTTKQFYMATQF